MRKVSSTAGTKLSKSQGKDGIQTVLYLVCCLRSENGGCVACRASTSCILLSNYYSRSSVLPACCTCSTTRERSFWLVAVNEAPVVGHSSGET